MLHHKNPFRRRPVDTGLINLHKLPRRINNVRVRELWLLLRDKDYSVIPELVDIHTRLAIIIASEYASYAPLISDDFVGEALAAIVEGCRWAARRANRETTNLTGYIVARIHSRCVQYLRNDKLIPIPHATYARWLSQGKKMKTPCVESVSRYCSTYTDYSPIDIAEKASCVSDVRDMIEKSIENDFERAIVNLKIEGYNNHQVSKILQCPHETVSRHLKKIERRYMELESEKK